MPGLGCYTCSVCGRLTRPTGENNGSGMCLACYEYEGWNNYHQDHDHKTSPDKNCPVCMGIEAKVYGLHKGNIREIQRAGEDKGVSYTVAVKVYGEEGWTNNSIRFETTEQAEWYGKDLASRWALR